MAADVLPRYSGSLENTASRSDWTILDGRYITVFDLPVDSKRSPLLHMTTEEDGSTKPKEFHELPAQDADMARVYIVHETKHDKALKTHLEQLLAIPFSELCGVQSQSTIPTLSRRLEDDQMTWWLDGIYTFGTALESEGLFSNLVRCRLRLRCIWHDNLMMCFIFCEAKAAAYPMLKPKYISPVEISKSIHRELQQLSTNIMRLQISFTTNTGKQVNGPSRSTQLRIMMLHVYYAVLIGHATFFSKTKYPHRLPLQGFNIATQSAITPANFQILLQDSYLWEQIQKNITDSLIAVEYLQSSLRLVDNLFKPEEHQQLALDISYLSTDLEKRVDFDVDLFREPSQIPRD